MGAYRVEVSYTRAAYEEIYVEADNDDEATDLALDELPWYYDNAEILSVRAIN